MKHYRFPAQAFIGYIRICRPGSILGPQQQFLCDVQEKYFKKGEKFRKERGMTDELCLKLDKLQFTEKAGNSMSAVDSKKAKEGEEKQGDYLVNRKYKK